MCVHILASSKLLVASTYPHASEMEQPFLDAYIRLHLRAYASALGFISGFNI